MSSAFTRTRVRIASVVLACVAALTGLSGGYQAINHHAQSQTAKAANNRIHFYKVIAGEESGGTPSVDNTLAKDLKTRLGPQGAGALPEPITAFRGNSNAYGGITEAIGQDPFDESGLSCFECGPLDQETQANLLLVKHGQIDVVIQKTAIHVSTGYTLTPWGIGILAYGLLWAVGLSAFFFGAPTWRFYVSRRFDAKVRKNYPDYAETLSEVDTVLDRINAHHNHDPKVTALVTARDDLMDQLRHLTRAKSMNGIEDEVKDAEIRMTDLRATLDRRKEIAKELESL